MLEKNHANNIPIKQNKINEKEKKEKTKSDLDALFNRYKNMITDKNQIMVEDILIYLNQIYISLRKEHLIYREKALSLLETIINKLNGSQIEFSLFKDYILERTMIFFILIKMYISNDNNKLTYELLAKLLKSLLIGNIEMIKTLSNIFPNSLFEKIQMDPDPFNWINEWDEFLIIIKQNFAESKLIWNEECRNELIKYLNVKFDEFDEINFSNILEKNDKEEKENNLNKINIDENSFEFEQEYNKNVLKKLEDVSVEYSNYKMEYTTLKNEVFVWKYYLKKLIKEDQGIPSFVIEIENPKKLWKKIKTEIYLENKPERIVVMLKVLILLYKTYYSNKRKTRKDFKPLGKFKDYDFFLNLYKAYENIEIKTYIIQLLYVSVRCNEQKAENRKELLNQEDTSSIILSYIRLIESSIKGESFSINFDVEICANKPFNSFYIDKEKESLKFYKDIESQFFTINNGNFINYSNYCPVDEESWKNSNNKYKLLCIVCSLYHYLKKQFKRNNKENKNDLPLFPIPNITKILYIKNNYISLMKLLLYDDYNLSFQALNLFMYYIVDLLNEGIGNEFCTIDILFILMIKYKSLKILKNIEKISASYIKRNKKTVYEDLKLSEEEIEFFDHYSTFEKQKNPQVKLKKPVILLIRYFPLPIIYYLMSHKFEDFINLIYTKEDNIYKRRYK